MPYPLIIKEAARLDIQEAYDYYEQQQAGLGERFLTALRMRLTAIAEHPEYYSYIDDKKILRDVLVNKFPYLIVYAIISEQVRVYAVHLTHRRSQTYFPE